MRMGGGYENSPFNGYWAFGEPAATQVFGPDLLLANKIPISLWGLPSHFTTNADLLKLPLAPSDSASAILRSPRRTTPRTPATTGATTSTGRTAGARGRTSTINYGIAWQFESTLTNSDLDKPALLAPIMDSLAPTLGTGTTSLRWSALPGTSTRARRRSSVVAAVSTTTPANCRSASTSARSLVRWATAASRSCPPRSPTRCRPSPARPPVSCLPYPPVRPSTSRCPPASRSAR